MIANLNGTDIKYVMRKKLFSTDLSEHHNRLSLTCKENYLTQTEKEILDAKEDNKLVDLEVVVLDPNFRDLEVVVNMLLKMWWHTKKSLRVPLHAFD
jgi:hypothetical protein